MLSKAREVKGKGELRNKNWLQKCYNGIQEYKNSKIIIEQSQGHFYMDL